MIYLAMQRSGDRYVVKVSATGSRISYEKDALKQNNPLAIIRSSCAGKSAQAYIAEQELSKLGVRIYGTHWYEVSQGVFELLYEQGLKVLRPRQKTIHLLDEF